MFYSREKCLSMETIILYIVQKQNCSSSISVFLLQKYLENRQKVYYHNITSLVFCKYLSRWCMMHDEGSVLTFVKKIKHFPHHVCFVWFQ